MRGSEAFGILAILFASAALVATAIGFWKRDDTGPIARFRIPLMAITGAPVCVTCGEWAMGRWGDGAMGRWAMGRWGDESMGRWGDGRCFIDLVYGLRSAQFSGCVQSLLSSHHLICLAFLSVCLRVGLLQCSGPC